jgi:hypothetical protein
MARVTITEVAPDADQTMQLIKDDPVRGPRIVQAFIKQSEYLLRTRTNRRRAIEKALNETARKDAQERKSIALSIAADLMRQDRTLRFKRKRNELARRIQTHWPKGKLPAPSARHICRWLTENR